MEGTATPCMGAMRGPGQVVYQGQWAGRPGQIGIGRLISQTQHEGRHSNSMRVKRGKKWKTPKGTGVWVMDLPRGRSVVVECGVRCVSGYKLCCPLILCQITIYWFWIIIWKMWKTFNKNEFSMFKQKWIFYKSFVLRNVFGKCYQFRPRFTNSLCQRKPSFGVKIVLSVFTKDAQWRISAKKAWTVIFAPDLIEHAFVGVSLSDAKFLGEYYNESRNAIY